MSNGVTVVMPLERFKELESLEAEFHKFRNHSGIVMVYADTYGSQIYHIMQNNEAVVALANRVIDLEKQLNGANSKIRELEKPIRR
jgi:hypothetical protein